MTHSTAYAQWAGTSLVQQACSGTTGREVVWNRLIAEPCDPYNSSQWWALG